MATSLVEVNRTEISMEDSGKTVVNISIAQEPLLFHLAKGVEAAGLKWEELAPEDPEPSASATAPAQALCTGEQKVLGGAQILLGVMCLSLGGTLSLFRGYLPVTAKGAPFWMGSAFVVSGSLSVLSERHGSFWVILATLFNLASAMAGCAGLAVGMADVPYLTDTPDWINDWCTVYDGNQPWRATRRMNKCKEKMLNLLNVVNGVHFLLLVSSVAALGIALFCFGYGLHVFYRSRRVLGEAAGQAGNED